VEYRYSSTLPSTLALDEVGDQRHAPAALPPRKTRYPLYRKLSGPQGRSGRVRNISPPPEFDPRTVQPVASRYADCAHYCHYFGFFKQISDNICALCFWQTFCRVILPGAWCSRRDVTYIPPARSCAILCLETVPCAGCHLLVFPPYNTCHESD